MQSFQKKFTSYMNGNLGLDSNLVDAWSQAVADGQDETSIGGAITVMVIDQAADARIKEGAQVNQTLSGSGQDVTVDATSVSHLVSLGGNFVTPSFTSATGAKTHVNPRSRNSMAAAAMAARTDCVPSAPVLAAAPALANGGRSVVTPLR